MTNARLVWLWWILSSLAIAVGCSGDAHNVGGDAEGEPVGQVRQALSSEQERVLQFEAPTSDWTTTAGTLSAASVVEQGSAALAVSRPQTWTEVCSRPLASLGSVGSTLMLKLWQQATPAWGTVQLFVRVPSKGHWNTPVNPPVTLHDKTSGVFHTLTFPLGAVSAVLSGTYTDLTLCFVINASAGLYALDDARFSGLTTAASSSVTTTTTGTGGTGGGGTAGSSTTGTEATSTTASGADGGSAGSGGTAGTGGSAGTGGGGDLAQCTPESSAWDRLVLRFPRGVSLDDIPLSAQGGTLDIHDGVAVRSSDGAGFASVSTLGDASELTELGASAETGNVYSVPPVYLRSNAIAHGFVKSGGIVSQQAGAQVEKATLENFDHEPYETVEIPYQFPSAPNPTPGVITNGSTVTLPPGGYGNVSVQAQSRLKLSAGTYTFESLNLEPGTTLDLNNATGGISLYIRGAFKLKVAPAYTAPNKYNVLFAVTGAGPIQLEKNFRGTLIAPNADVALPTATVGLGHHGGVHAKSLTVHQHTDFYHHPYQRDAADCASADPQGLGGIPGCPAHDSDGDGFSDCFEDNDGSAFSDPEEYNGFQVTLSDVCHTGEGLLAEDIDTREEIEECLDNATNTESVPSSGGSGWPAPGGDTICSIDYGFGVAWTNCRDRGLIHVVGVFEVTQEQSQCFRVIDGSATPGQNTAISALLLPASVREAPITAADGVVCVELPLGIHRIEWIYEFVGRSNHGFEVSACFSADGDCVPPDHSDLIDQLLDNPGMSLPLLPCEEGECKRQCPCETGDECESDADCGAGVCGEDNGGHFDKPPGADVCWAAGCSVDVFEAGCGPANEPCGLCHPISNLCSDDSDCAAGDVCGEGNGLNFGLSASDRVCWPVRCQGTPDPSDVGSLSSPCGVGLCQPSCEGKSCGDLDGCSGYCALCASPDVIEGGCVDDGQCVAGYECAANGTCADPACQEVWFFEANCGSGELCGPCLECESGCGSNACGVDPRCGGQCGEGTCADGSSCMSGLCVSVPEQVEPVAASTVGRLEGTFSVTPNGAASYTIPIVVPPGRAGVAPDLSVVYTSGKEDGILGMGWQLAGLPYIARCPSSKAQAAGGWARPVRLDGDDRLCLGEEMLVPENPQADYGENATYYRTERETFTRFRVVGQEEDVNGTYVGPLGFIAQTKDGLEYFYGHTDDSSVFVHPRANRVKRSWALHEVRDRNGNAIQVKYRDAYDPVDGGSETLELLPWSIRYAPGDREVRFVYEPRSEQRIQYTTGARIHHTQRLASIQTVVGDRVTRAYDFLYEEQSSGNPLARPLLLTEARECVIEDETKRCKTGTSFVYQGTHGLVATEPEIGFDNAVWAVMDLNGDGMDDIVADIEVGLATGNRQVPFSRESYPPLYGPPFNMDHFVLERGLQSRVLDYDGDGTDEFVNGSDDGGYRTPLSFYRWNGENFAEVYRTPEVGGERIDHIKTVDLNGDGLKDIYACVSEQGQKATTLWLSQRDAAGVSYSDLVRSDTLWPSECDPARNLFLDVDGDGVANIVRQEVPSGTWKYLADIADFTGRWLPLRNVVHVDVDWADLPFGVGTIPNSIYVNVLGAVELDGSDYEPLSLRVANTNGDRLVDLFEHSPEGLITWTAVGGGFKYHSGPDPSRYSPGLWAEADVVDYDGDGRDDLIFDKRLYQATDKGLVETSLDGFDLGRMVGDFDGDGVQDYLTHGTGPSGRPGDVHYGNTRTSFLLWVVTDGLGLEHEISYDRTDPEGQATYSTNTAGCAGTDTYCIKKPPPLVSAVQVWESRMGPGYEERVMQEFHYKDLRRGVDGRGAYGMGERIVTTYRPGRLFADETREVYHNDSFELAGVLKSRETRTATLEPTRVAASHSRTVTEETEWEVRLSDAGRPFPFPAETRTVAEDEDATGALHELYHVTVTRDADVYGNLTDVDTVAGDPRIVNAPSVIRRTSLTIDYEHETDASRVQDWLIALPSHRTETSSRSVFLSPEREMAFSYDDDGLLVTATRLGSGSVYQHTTLVRDQHGNVEVLITRDADGNEREQRTTYDSRGLFPESFINAEGEQSSVRMNEALGHPDEVIDPNGLSDRFYYDGFGRLARVEGWEGDVDYEYSDPAFGPGALDPASDGELAKQRVTVTTSQGAHTYADTDAFGRTVRSMTRGLFDTEVIQSFVYDWDGSLMRESRPHENGDFSQGVIEYEYDSWRRLSATHFPDSTSIERYYATPSTYVGSGSGLPPGDELFQLSRGLSAEFVTKRGNPNTTSGLPIDGAVATDHLGFVQTASDATAQLTDFRYSEFDLLDRIDHVRGDGLSIDTRITYDLWGRIRSVDDPDASHTSYTYTGFDEVDTATDAEGVVTNFGYDNVGRLTERRHTEGSETLLTTWTYGNSPSSNNIGRVAQASSPDGIVTEYFFKEDGNAAFGLPDRVVTSVPRTSGSADVESFSLQYLYDPLKRVREIVYPSAAAEPFSVELTRDDRGNLRAVADGTDPAMVYWEATADYQGVAVSQECLGNEVCTNTTFEDVTGRVQSIESQIGPQAYSPGDLIQDLKYQYYPSGLLEEQTDPSLPVHSLRIYSYDALDRIRTEVVGIGASVTWYEYDHLGNLTLKNDQALAYDRPDSFQPHAVRAMGDNEYEYDDKGNQVLRTGPDVAGGRQQVRYTPFNLPKQVDTGPASSPDVTTFDYDAHHTRTVKRTQGATTLFIDGLYERVEPHDASGERTHKYHVFAGGLRVAQVSRTEAIALGSLEPSEYQFLSRDRLGSVHTVTDVDGDVVDPQRTYDPFGRPRDELSPEGDVRAGFTGHEHDLELGLIDMRGRVYDPLLGRFLTPDPLANPLNLQSLNRYSYVLNSPMNLVDPSGFQGGPPSSGIPTQPPAGCSGCTWVDIAGPNKGMGGGGGMWVQDDAGAEQPVAPQDLGHADPAESGAGQSQTTPRPSPGGADRAAPGEGAAPQPAAGAAPPAPDHSTAPISSPGNVGASGGPPTQGRGGGPEPGGSRQAPGDAGQGTSGWPSSGGGGHGNLGVLAEATTQIRDTSSFWNTALQVATAVMPGPGSGSGLLGVGIQATMWARGALAAAAKGLPQVAPGAIWGICFAKGTPVHTSEGLKPIEEVAVDDLVWAWHEETGELSLRRVVRLFETPDQPLVEVTIAHDDGSQETIRATPDHPFWTEEGWAPVHELEPDDRVLLRSGSWSSVGVLRDMGARETVYNFEVETLHTYYVGEAGALVHNSSSISADLARAAIAKLPASMFKPLQCKQCASAIVEALKAQGIRGQVLNIRAAGDFIASDLVRGGTTSITRNGFHQAVQVGDMVFDNFFPAGVAYPNYVASLHAIGGVAISAAPF